MPAATRMIGRGSCGPRSSWARATTSIVASSAIKAGPESIPPLRMRASRKSKRSRLESLSTVQGRAASFP
ncbi:MAG: hypothetical protein QM811_24380 [Pirellulales bacterium]